MDEKKCERRGMVWLDTALGKRVILPTTCKTWGCGPCSASVLALFRARLEIGVSRLGRCAFITVTYKRQNRIGQRADVSGKDWRALIRRLKLDSGKVTPWLKVTELTAARVPHHHLVVSAPVGRLRCYGPDTFDGKLFKRGLGSCDCLSHVWGRAWLSVTGDSYITHVVPVTGPARAGWYLGKYMVKTATARGDLHALGYLRRWSSSRDWPGGGRLRLWQTGHGGWRRRSYLPRWPSKWLVAQSDKSLLRREGENLTLLLMEKRAKVGALARLERLANVKTHRA